MNASDFNRLKETAWRRPLDPEEERQLRAWLASHPESATGWSEEEALRAVLTALPDVPVPSNFTALVLQQVDRETASAEVGGRGLAGWWPRLLHGWLPRAAGVAAAVVLVSAGWYQYRSFRQELVAHGMVQLSFAAASVPEPQVFEDFDAIRRFNPAPATSDEALFAVLSQ